MVDKAAAHDGGGGSGGLISPKAPQIFSKAVQFFWKVNHDTREKFIFAWLSILFKEQAKTISQKNAKNLHVILAWICLLRFFYYYTTYYV